MTVSDSQVRDLAVVLWRGDGDAILRIPALANVPVDFGDETYIDSLGTTVRDRTGFDTTILHLGDDVAHLELLGDAVGWIEPDVAIPGGNAWNRVGWLDAVTAEIDRCVHRTGPPRVMKHWSISTLVRVPAAPRRVAAAAYG